MLRLQHTSLTPACLNRLRLQHAQLLSKHEHNIVEARVQTKYHIIKQATMKWYEKHHQALFHFDFVLINYSFFIYSNQGIIMDALVYIDNILITSSSSELVHNLINKLHLKLTLKKLDRTRYLLAIEVSYHA